MPAHHALLNLFLYESLHELRCAGNALHKIKTGKNIKRFLANLVRAGTPPEACGWQA